MVLASGMAPVPECEPTVSVHTDLSKGKMPGSAQWCQGQDKEQRPGTGAGSSSSTWGELLSTEGDTALEQLPREGVEPPSLEMFQVPLGGAQTILELSLKLSCCLGSIPMFTRMAGVPRYPHCSQNLYQLCLEHIC